MGFKGCRSRGNGKGTPKLTYFGNKSPHLFLKTYFIFTAQAYADDHFECYQGRGDTYSKRICDQCRYGTACMCIKIPEFPVSTVIFIRNYGPDKSINIFCF